MARPPASPPKSTDDTFNATTYGPTCPQSITNELFSRQDEDCLNLDIWAPSSGTNLPVFVYMYGGAMVTGSNSNPQIQGTNFAREGVVYVNFNTRESVWASANSKESDGEEVQNFGMLDVEMVMEWVHENIEAFGGNDSHIVFAGHSSGSVHVDYYLWRHPATWLAGAVEMSANALSGPAYAPPNSALDIVAADVGCPVSLSNQTHSQLSCLKGKSIHDLQTTLFNTSTNTLSTPTIDSTTLFPSSSSTSFTTRPTPLPTSNPANQQKASSSAPSISTPSNNNPTT
ncbi:Para-nitrobenzyl esterase [Fulvia fulva]|nr:Para-nitrobenzyl esterase [Fulvia fulva]KAK4609766.1 Para-nitrobenzyl esterase [Fulvia fulva]WPV37873.1 Para-nitrobenzyl esterase [Fulvia fulva]